MTDSNGKNDPNGITFTDGAYTPQDDSLLISGAQTARIQQSEWEYSNKGTDFARTEAIFVMRTGVQMTPMQVVEIWDWSTCISEHV